MSRFMKLELENVIAWSRHHYNEETGYGDEEDHVKAIKASSAHFVNVHTIDAVAATEHTTKNEQDEDVTSPATYLVFLFESGIKDRGASGNRDRDSFILVDGTAESWLEKINAAIASDAALHHPEPAGQRVTDRGVWQSGETYSAWDMTAHPETGEKLLCVSDHESSSKLELIDKTKWRGLGEITF